MNRYESPLIEAAVEWPIGRDDVGRRWTALMERAREGEGGILVLQGDIGVGKTTVARTLVRHCGPAGFATVTFGQQLAPSAGVEPPRIEAWAPWNTVLQEVASLVPPGDRRRIEKEHPALRDLRAGARVEAGSSIVAVQTPATGDEIRAGTVSGIAAVLQAAAAHRPIALILDDAHTWSSVAADALRALVEPVRRSPVLIAFTTRPEGLGSGPLRDLAEGAGDSWLRLRPLDKGEVAAVIRRETGIEPHSTVIESAISATEGNPLDLRDFLHDIRAGGIRLDGELAASAKLKGTRPSILRRLDEADTWTRNLIEVLSVCGSPTRVRLLARIAGTPSGQAGEALRLAPLLTEADGTWCFDHERDRETVYSSLDSERRAEIHEQVLIALEEARRASLGQLAFHALRCAYRDPARAAGHARRAADDLAAGGHFVDAQEMVDAGLAALDLLDEENARVTLDLLLLRHHVRWLAGADRDVLGTEADAMTELARSEPDPGSRAEMLAEVALARSRVWAEFDLQEDPNATVRAEAIEALEDRRPDLQAQLIGYSAQECSWNGDPDRGKALADEAVALARETQDSVLLAQALCRWAETCWSLDHAVERLRCTKEAFDLVRLDRSAPGLDTRIYALSLHLIAAIELADGDEIRRTRVDLDRAIGSFPTKGHLFTKNSVAVMFGLANGLLDGLDEQIEAGYETVSGLMPMTALQVRLAQTFFLGWEHGDVSGIVGDLDEVIEDIEQVKLWHTAKLWVELEMAPGSDVRDRLRAIVEDRIDHPLRTRLWFTELAVLAHTCWLARDAESASALYKALQPYQGRLVIGGWPTVILGPVDRLLGLLKSLETPSRGAKPAEIRLAAAAHLEAAEELSRAIGARAWEIRSLADRAEVLVDDLDSGRAFTEAIQRAQQRCGSGLPALAARIDSLVDRRAAGGVGPNPRVQMMLILKDVLRATDGEIAEIVGGTKPGSVIRPGAVKRALSRFRSTHRELCDLRRRLEEEPALRRLAQHAEQALDSLKQLPSS